MRIALVTGTYTPQVNGVTTVVRRIVTTLQRAGVPVAVVAPRYPEGGAEWGELRIRSLPSPPDPSIRLSLPRRATVYDFLDRFTPFDSRRS